MGRVRPRPGVTPEASAVFTAVHSRHKARALSVHWSNLSFTLSPSMPASRHSSGCMRGVIIFLGSSVPIEGASQHQPMSANEVQTGRRLPQRRRCLSADVVQEDCAVWFAPRSLVPGAARSVQPCLCHAGLRGRRCATACNVERIASKGTWTPRLLWAPVENSATGTCQ